MTIRLPCRTLGMAAFFAFLLYSACQGSWGQSASPENRIKAVYLKNMLNFVRWPVSTAPAKDGAFRFCVEADAPLGFALAQELRTTTIDDRRVEVRWAQKEQHLKDCQALFVGASAAKRFAKLLEGVKGASVHTFGEGNGFLEAGGVVQLSYESNAVRFGVNLTAARTAGLRMDPRLLGVAKRVVKPGEMPGG
ncbi:MAG: YfiR family protein [Candidatus Acidiferrum sp.]